MTGKLPPRDPRHDPLGGLRRAATRARWAQTLLLVVVCAVLALWVIPWLYAHADPP